MTMVLAFHGGACCGIKTIHGFSVLPKHSMEPALNKIDQDDRDLSVSIAYEATPKTRFFHEAAPMETSLERLDRYLAYCDKRRPNGIIEVAICDSEFAKQVKAWAPLLRRRGFRKVTDCNNSNTDNRILVFHRKRDNK